MDSNWNTTQGGAATGSSSGVRPDSNANLDWRLQLQPDARQRIVNRIMDTLIKRRLPEGLNELQKMAVRLLEEKIYSDATSQPDYLRKFSLKILSMETKAQPGLGPNIPNQNRVNPEELPKPIMDSNWNTVQGGAATGSSSGVQPNSNENLDWRLQLYPDARQRIINKIMDTLKRDLPVPVPEGLNEIQKIAVRFEEKIYSAATSQPDYLRKISLKMLSMETKAQQGLGPNIPNQNRVDPGGGMMSQQQLQQMHNHPIQLQQKSNISAMAQPNSLSMPSAMQLGIQNAVESDQLVTSGTGLGHLAKAKSRKCKICGDCAHKRRKRIEVNRQMHNM